MRALYPIVFVVLSLLICGEETPPATNVSLASVFGDHMVLQRESRVSIWGTALPAGEVIVEIDGIQEKAKVDRHGNWKAVMPPRRAGGPYTLRVIGKDTITLQDVFFGDVWLASGQSNMEFPLRAGRNYRAALSEIDGSNIRFLKVPLGLSSKTLQNIGIKSDWVKATKENAGSFSAVAYFFAKELQEEENVPLGIIQSAVGGTPAEYWTSYEMLQTVPGFHGITQNNSKNDFYFAMASQVAESRASIIRKAASDLKSLLHKASAGPWKKIAVPGLWEQEELPEFDGFVLYKKSLYISEIPKEEKDLTLQLGKIDDDDITWFNGQKIGETQGVTKERTYLVPHDLVKQGENELIIRVLDTGGGGGFIGSSKDMVLRDETGKTLAPLAGEWLYNSTVEPELPTLDFRPAYLYNAMIAPLIPYTIKGVIWYQGENNAERAYQYQKLFPTLIEDWRIRWKQGYFPFLFVQLANYKQEKPVPADDAWAELREAQSMALRYPNTGMAVTIDIGEGNDIHPRNKLDVGKRLSLAALKIAYHKDLVHSGPTYESMKIKDNAIEITFSKIGGGLVLKHPQKTKSFAIAGKNKKFYWASAKIEEGKVLVFSPEVPDPVAVRYAWASNPQVSLYNREGLPASPFRTDSWKGITEKKTD